MQKENLTNVLQSLYPTPNTLELATVISINPLSIRVGQLVLEHTDLLVAQHLIDFDRKINLNVNANGETVCGAGAGSINSIRIDSKTMNFESMLKVDDTVVVQSINNGQTYIVLDKVVTI